MWKTISYIDLWVRVQQKKVFSSQLPFCHQLLSACTSIDDIEASGAHITALNQENGVLKELLNHES